MKKDVSQNFQFYETAYYSGLDLNMYVHCDMYGIVKLMISFFIVFQ